MPSNHSDVNDSQPLIEKRIGLTAISAEHGFFGSYSKVSWPLGKLRLTFQRLELSSLLMDYEVPLSAIQFIKAGCFTMQIVHNHPSVPTTLWISGFGLRKAIETAIRKHNLTIVLKP